MTEKKNSHIMVISEDFKITDLGEYGHKNIRQMFGLPLNALIIEYPRQHEKKYFLSTSDKIGIVDMMSCSNKKSHCLIFGSIAGEPIKQEDGWLYRIRPYFSLDNREAVLTDMVARWTRENQEQENPKELINKLRKQLKEGKEQYSLDKAVHINEDWNALCGYKHSAGERLILTILSSDVTCPRCLDIIHHKVKSDEPKTGDIKSKRCNPIVERMKRVKL